MQSCSLQHRTLLLSPVTSTAGYCFCFGAIPSFFLELFLHWSPVAYWAPTDLGISSFSILSFCLFILFMGFSRQEYWRGLPFQWTTFCQTSPPWLTCLGWPHTAWLSFIELDKAMVLVWLDWLVFCDYGFSVSALSQHLPSYLGFSYLGCGVSLHGCSSKAQPLLLTLDEGYLLTAAPPDLEHGVAPLGPPVSSKHWIKVTSIPYVYVYQTEYRIGQRENWGSDRSRSLTKSWSWWRWSRSWTWAQMVPHWLYSPSLAVPCRQASSLEACPGGVSWWAGSWW